jgi:hypothetical protein
LIVYGAVNQIKKIVLMAFEFPELYDRLELLPVYLESKDPTFISDTLKTRYKEFITMFEKRNNQFKVIDALEQSVAYDLCATILPELRNVLKDDLDLKLAESMKFNKHITTKFPSFGQRGEDLNLTRQSPFMPINPLKAHKANPIVPLNKAPLPREKRYLTGAVFNIKGRNRPSTPTRKSYTTKIGYLH